MHRSDPVNALKIVKIKPNKLVQYGVFSSICSFLKK